MQSLTSNDEVVVGKKGLLKIEVEDATARDASGYGEYTEMESNENTVYTNDYFTEKSQVIFLLGEIIAESSKGDTAVIIAFCRIRFVKVCHL